MRMGTGARFDACSRGTAVKWVIFDHPSLWTCLSVNFKLPDQDNMILTQSVSDLTLESKRQELLFDNDLKAFYCAVVRVN